MKKIVLACSALVSVVATGLAIHAALNVSPSTTGTELVRMNLVAGYLGLLSISLFFVGLATPKS